MGGDRPVGLYCFAHAGAGVSCFRSWRAVAGPGVRVVPVQLPGRQERRRQPRLCDRSGVLAELLDPLLRAADQGPYALYGHSLGALVAYTLARELARSAARPPVLVAVGACVPPDARTALLEAADAPDGDLAALLGTVGGLPRAAGEAPGSLWHRRVLPVLRDDLRLAADLRRAAVTAHSGGPLPVPLLSLAGRSDSLVDPRQAAGWSRWTTSAFNTAVVPGDHFFVRGPHAPALVARACTRTATATAAARR